VEAASVDMWCRGGKQSTCWKRAVAVGSRGIEMKDGLKVQDWGAQSNFGWGGRHVCREGPRGPRYYFPPILTKMPFTVVSIILKRLIHLLVDV